MIDTGDVLDAAEKQNDTAMYNAVLPLHEEMMSLLARVNAISLTVRALIKDVGVKVNTVQIPRKNS
jgi:hypothetical protein